jgi:hypothetical protein
MQIRGVKLDTPPFCTVENTNAGDISDGAKTKRKGRPRIPDYQRRVKLTVYVLPIVREKLGRRPGRMIEILAML